MYFLKKMKIYSKIQDRNYFPDKKNKQNSNPKKGDIEGFVNFLSITDIMFSVFLKEEDDQIKISFRSQGDFPTNKFALNYSSGGGYLNASGAESKLFGRNCVKDRKCSSLRTIKNGMNFLNTKE